MELILVLSFLVLLVLGVPIAFSIGLSALLALLLTIDPLAGCTTVAQQMTTGLDSFTLLAIPFFILSGQLMNHGGIARRLIAFARLLIGHIPGGLAFINIIANMLFGAISGSAVASASAIGGIMSPVMRREGYPPSFGAAVNITSATTGLIIPPSNVLIVYSLASGGVSIAALFIAGYIPGILTGLALIAATAFMSRKKQRSASARLDWKQSLRVFFDAVPSLLLLVIVIGGIVAGIFTATEASAIAVLYTLILAFIYREVKTKDLPRILLKTVEIVSLVLFLVAASMALSWTMAYGNIPQELSQLLMQISHNKYMVLLILNIFLLMIGVFMDITPAVLIFTPIFLPVVKLLGLDPIHFGIIIVLNLCVGLCTPPVGTVLFVGCSVGKVSINEVIKPLLPLFAVMVLILLLVTYLPVLSLWLPRLLGLL